MTTCASCGRAVDGDVAEDTPCPTCGTPLLAGKPIEVDPSWAAEKQAKVDAHAAANAPKKPNIGARVLLGLVTASMIGVVIVMVTQRQPAVRGAEVGEIELRIVSPKDGQSVAIDGAPAGKTPLVLRLPKSTIPMKIIGNNVAITVIPDQSRTVNLVERKKVR